MFKDQGTAEILGLRTFMQARALATQALVLRDFTVFVSWAKRKSLGSQETTKKNSFMEKASKNQDVIF